MTTTTRRFDLYQVPHKGLRRAMFEAAGLLGRTDFADAAESERAAERLEGLVHFCAEHMENEDRVVMPVLREIAPDVHARLQEGHDHHEAAFDQLRALVARLRRAASADERSAVGDRLRQSLHLYLAADLEHMNVEETDAMQALWAHRTDAELLALHVAIVSAIPLPEMAAMGAFIVPALSLPERAALLAGFQASVPAELLPELFAPARRELTAQEWDAAEAAARALLAAQAGAPAQHAA